MKHSPSSEKHQGAFSIGRQLTNGGGGGSSSGVFTFDIKSVSKWSIEDTLRWLKSIEYEECGPHFVEHKINGRALLMLAEEDVKEIIRHNVGQRKNLYHLIRVLQIHYNRSMSSKSSSISSFFSSSSSSSSSSSNSSDDNDDNADNDGEDEGAPEAPENQSKHGDNDGGDLNDYENNNRERSEDGAPSYATTTATRKRNARRTSEPEVAFGGSLASNNDIEMHHTSYDAHDSEANNDAASACGVGNNGGRSGAVGGNQQTTSEAKSSLIHRHLIDETYKELLHHRRNNLPHSETPLASTVDFSLGATVSSNKSARHHKHKHHRQPHQQLQQQQRRHKEARHQQEHDQIDTDEHSMPNFCENCLKKFDHSPYTNYAPHAGDSTAPAIRISSKGEKRKTLISIVYLFLTCLWTSFMLTVVHDRVPDMQKYPPLPDLILDNVPLIPWAFFATELIGMLLLLAFFTIIFFHKYRSIIFRRMCSLAGTIFFLRSITMLITSLSVPGEHIKCSSQRYGSLLNKLNGAWNILSGGGLYVQGVRTCGDYMFSGHTVWLTLLTHFITEYTPASMHLLHTSVWVLNVFGLFFILGAHEHYSIDVFVAFYITSRLFLYYHSLANNKVLFQRDHKRVKIWFPMLSYFESNIHSMVPNEYQCPTNPLNYAYRFLKHKVFRKHFHSSKSSKKLATAVN